MPSRARVIELTLTMYSVVVVFFGVIFSLSRCR